MSGNVLLPYIPETITVHLGPPSVDAANVTVPFTDYIKNVASSEIYPTWPENALRANILAQISFTLNRVYTEFYRSRGYSFDITNSTAFDQSFVNGRDIFENISQLVDEIFDQYLRRTGSVEPLFATYCDGVRVQCDGLSQWGSVDLAENGRTPYEILTYYYGDNLAIVRNAPIAALTESYPGTTLRLGNSGNEVRYIQLRLNRIAKNYPSIPTIPNPDGIFGPETEAAVREFQRIFNLTVDGIVGRATWYKIVSIYGGVKRLTDLASEGIFLDEVTQLQPDALRRGDTGNEVRELQYYLNFIGTFNNQIQPVAIDGIFGTATEQSVLDFQRYYGLPETGVVNVVTWNAMQRTYLNLLDSLPASAFDDVTLLYPGYVLRVGARGEAVTALQTYLNRISDTYPTIPKLTIDGVFGSATESAVRAYQELFDIPNTGVVGSVTWNSITSTYQSL